MRKKALYIMGATLIILLLVGFFLGDLILKWSLERSLETIVGAKAEISQFHLNLARTEITIGRLQVANPHSTWRNLFEASQLRFQLAATPLYSGKTVIEAIEVEQLMLDTPRRTDGRLHRKPLPGPFGVVQAKLSRDIAAMPIFNLNQLTGKFDLNQLLSQYKFETDFSALDLKGQLEQANQDWNNNLKELDQTKLRLAEVEQKFQTFQGLKGETLLELNQKLNLFKDIQKSLNSLNKQISTTKKGFNQQFAALDNDIDGLRAIADGDYRALLKMSQLPDFKNINIAESLVGKDLLNESTTFLNLFDQLQKMLPVKLVDPAKLHLRGGQDITFPGRQTFPRLLIKQITVSGRGTPSSNLQGYYGRGTVTGITSEPPLLGRPIQFALFGQAPNRATLDFSGSLNHVTSNYRDQMYLRLQGLAIPELRLAEINPLLPSKLAIENAKIYGSLTMQPGQLLLQLNLDARNLAVDYSNLPEPKNLTASIIKEAISQADLLTLSYRLQGSKDHYQMQLDSNLNQIIAARLNAVVGARVAGYLQGIRLKVEERLQLRQAELQGIYAQYQLDLGGRIDQVQSLFDLQQQQLEQRKKELQEQITQSGLPLQLPK